MLSRPKLALMTGVCMIACASSVHAQTQQADGAVSPASPKADSTTLGEIIVTAQKRAEVLQQVPIAITAVSAQALKVAGVTQMTDIATLVPGLETTTSGTTILPRIRGVGLQIATAGDENSVATYIDGVYLASPSSTALQFNNINQIAVLKGPQGTLFGRNATGGVIQITTRDPQQAFQGQADVTYGNFNTVGGDLYLTGGLTERLAADLALVYNNQQEGFGTNLYDGHTIGRQESLAARSKWKLDLDDRTTVRFSLDYADIKGPYGQFVPIAGARPLGGAPYSGSPFDTDNNIDGDQSTSQWGASLNAMHSFDGVDIVSITAYRSSRAYSDGNFTGVPYPSADSTVIITERQFTQEIQLLSTGAGPLKWALGGYYFNGHALENDALVEGPFAAFNNGNQATESYAAFGQATYNFSKATALTLGLRYTTETKRYAGDTPSPFGPPSTASGDLTESRPTWRVALDHHFNDEILGYVSYDRGFKSGGFNLSAGGTPQQAFKPETLDAYEVGVKSEFLERRLRLNLAAFYYNYQNIQIGVFTPEGTVALLSGGPTTVYGLDADVTAVPIRHLTLTAGLSLNHSRFDNFPDDTFAVPLPTGGNTLAAGSVTGKSLPFSPALTYNLGADYVIDLPTGSLELGANYYHNDGWFAAADNRLRQGPYGLLNADLTWFIDRRSRYSVTAWGKNLANTAYATAIASNQVVDAQVTAPGRTFGLTLGAKF